MKRKPKNGPSPVSGPKDEDAVKAATYAHLCAQIGERHFLIARLSGEISVLTEKIAELQKEQSEPAT